MNYKEAVIVPLEVFNKCNFNPEEKELPPPKKLVAYLMTKLFLQTLKLSFIIRKRN